MLMTQAISSLVNELGDKSKVDELLSNLQNKFMFQTDDPETRKFAQELIGQHIVRRRSGGVGHTANDKGGGGVSSNSGWSESWEHWVRQEELGILKTGGQRHGNVVEMFLEFGGRTFKGKGERPDYKSKVERPYMKVMAHQNFQEKRIEMFWEKMPTLRQWIGYMTLREAWLKGKLSDFIDVFWMRGW